MRFSGITFRLFPGFLKTDGRRAERKRGQCSELAIKSGYLNKSRENVQNWQVNADF
jgi:hypothetical protein